MNKTVNINLAGTSFHIDEDAYGKLSRYLDAIRKSLMGADGSDEIMRDIEARIAELFSEKLENNTQVVTITELDQVIAVMGQPEDYQVDNEIFEDEPQASYSYTKSKISNKQLFRDIDDKYIGGVSSGIGHYIGLDAIWVRLFWVLLVVAGMGSPVLIYLLLWVLVPAAETTSQKLKMTGEPINISNIERKFKEGFDNVADRVKNADYDQYGQKIKTGATSFFDSLGKIILVLLRVFAKFIGVIMIIVAISVLIGLLVSFFTFGTVNFWGNNEIMEYISLADTSNTPLWLSGLLILFAVGIPFLALLILGLKLLVSNLKSMGATAKIALVILWAFSVMGLTIIGIRQATEQAYDGNFIVEKNLPVQIGDTLNISMKADKQYTYEVYQNRGLKIKYNADEKRVIYSGNISVSLKSSKDDMGRIVIEKIAEGNNSLDAKKRAESIVYNYSVENSSLILDGFFITDTSNKFRDQEVEITVYLPEGTVVNAEENVSSFYESDTNDWIDWNNNSHYFRILKNKNECLDCEEIQTETINDSIPQMENDTIIKEENWEEKLNQKLNQA